jgi:serine/threonine-protein kinase
MATVHLAEDVRHHRRVAIKVIHPELAAMLGPERFLKEIELTASLQHAHILPLLDSGSVDGLLFYVMPYVDGESLRSRLERERQLPVDDALRLAREVADALDYAHRHGVVHRDVKPENILLHDGRALVADFGIALAVQQAGGTRLTETGLSLGTPQYMAPEQATGERSIDARADVYALGAVTYEMLAGEPPFTAPTAQGVIAKLLTEDPRPLAQQRRSVPPHVDSAVLHALEKLPADRFATAAAFATAIGAPGGGHAAASHRAFQLHPAALGRRARLASILLTSAGLAVGLALGWAVGRASGHRVVRASGRTPLRFTLPVASG